MSEVVQMAIVPTSKSIHPSIIHSPNVNRPIVPTVVDLYFAPRSWWDCSAVVIYLLYNVSDIAWFQIYGYFAGNETSRKNHLDFRPAQKSVTSTCLWAWSISQHHWGRTLFQEWRNSAPHWYCLYWYSSITASTTKQRSLRRLLLRGSLPSQWRWLMNFPY